MAPAPTARLSLLGALAAAAAVTGAASPALAEDAPASQAADGSTACHELRDRNDRELHAFEKAQPAVPYQYPREKHFLNAPWAQFFSSMGRGGELILATLLPHVGAQFRGDAPAAYVGWPWSIFVFGPYYACTRKENSFIVHGHRAHRILVEPAIVPSKQGVGFSVRPGYRFIWHPTSWVVGPGIGLGSTLEIAGNQEPFRYSVGPELVAHFGNCCSSSYFTLTLRYDHYFKGNNRDIIGGSLGYVFF